MAARSKKKRSFFPEGFDDFLRLRAREGGGILILGLGFLLALALASFDPADPNFNHATPKAPHNWLGLPGAYTYDVLLQTLGLSAWLFVLLLASWGFRIVSHRGLPRWWLNVALVPLTLILFAAFAAALPVPTTWALRAGLGGVVGDFILYHQLVPFGVMFGLPISAVLPAVICFGLAVLSFYFASGLSMGEWRSMGAGLGFGAAATAGLAAQGIYQSGKAAVRAGQETQGFFSRLKSAFTRDDEDDKPVLRKAEPSFGKAKSKAVVEDDDYVDPDGFDDADAEDEDDMPRLPVAKRADEGRVTRRIEKPKAGSRAIREAQTTLNLGDAGDFELPELSLLKPPPADAGREKINEDALEQNARMLESVLNEFGVQGEITKVRPGPVVTLYELEPAPGTKSSRVIGLSDDIARSMSALSARVAVIPGRNAIGIELPNAKRETVYLRELLASAEFESPSTKLGLALGKDIGGSAIIADLTKMPHLLVAGTTGSGKSVAINTMILSLLYKLTPDQCRFIMVDPKMLELSVYDGIPHLLAPVVTEPGKAVVALKWTVREMEDRYRKMSELGVRNIASYNERLAAARAKDETLGRTVQTGFDEAGKPIYEERPIDLNPLPFIVVIVDELADLMLVAGKDIEAAIQRLAQMARAAGIHLIMATQRPSVDVITGTIKANFPTRISFQVTSKIDSRTILGEQGAEQLLGMGDMLFMPGAGRISRVHGPFVSDEEVERVVKTLKDQAEPIYVEAVTADADGGKYGAPGSGGEGGGSEEDSLYDQAVALVCRERKASTSFIQSHLQIGYNRAARIMERMEKEGVVGGANHVGKREVLARNIEAAE
jgi:S-DNA-T family DNA segregation ATPase FtsK/SpoIIIE